MRLKLLLMMLLVSSGILIAQDTIKTLVITEAKMDRAEQSYAEITNMGTVALNLKDFEFGRLSPWNGITTPPGWPSGCPQVDIQSIERLPDVVLQPGESYVIAAYSDYTEEAYKRDVDAQGYSIDWAQFFVNPKMKKLIDLPVNLIESPIGDPTDSVSRKDGDRLLTYYSAMETWGGRDVWYIRHHISATDSAVIDRVGGGTPMDGDNTFPDAGMIDVAGVTGATGNHYLIRKFNVKQGNTEFVPGIDITDSEWIPIPFMGNDQYNERFRGPFWTVGNHVNATLDETTLQSSNTSIDVDFAGKTITVPWGIRNDDSIMYQFDFVPGLAWHYDYVANHEDSAFSSIRTGDKLTIYACGNTLQTEIFTLNVLAPAGNAALVVPKYALNDDGNYTNHYMPYVVTDGAPVIDSIREVPYACRIDSLMKYIEIPSNASKWEIVWVDGNERVDLKYGDLLRITAADGSTQKDYFLKLQDYRPSRNADLSAITWPDIPDWLRDLYDWKGDTIPFFSNGVQNYTIVLPGNINSIPGLVAKPVDDNATVQVNRAVSLMGSVQERTITFTCVAANGVRTKVYTVTFQKEIDPQYVQPWAGDPFISQFVWQDQWASSFIEVVNPGTEIMDLSHYMFYFGVVDDPIEAIRSVGTVNDFNNRYNKYIPGRIWGGGVNDTTSWQNEPGTCAPDLATPTTVYPGDVFVIGDIWSTGTAYGQYGGAGNWPAEEACDINMGGLGDSNPCPWVSPPNAWTALRHWTDGHYYLYKIVGPGGDSVRNGTKAATDPNDFVVLDVFGMEGTATPVVGGETMQQTTGYTRKPNVAIGNTEMAGSFGTDAATSEWIKWDRPYFNSIGVYWAYDILRICDGLGSHYMEPATVGSSTVTSSVLKVSLGYSLDETILGEKEGTTVDQFLAKLGKKHPDQTLIVRSGGADITGDATLTAGDSLVVKSADGINTTRYLIEVTAGGSLSDNAVLTSTKYSVTTDPATVGGFELGELLKDVVAGVTVPAGANMSIINSHGSYVAMKAVNFDTAYVNVLASSDVYFEVVAEDGVTKITYQLKPNSTSSDAFVTSSVFTVDQSKLLISLIPQGTNVSALFQYLVPSEGATLKLLDKMGYERTVGEVVRDDRLIVTAADGVTTNIYYLSLLNLEANYLAYVISDVYTVDQEEMLISGTALSAEVDVTSFMDNLLPAEGASMETKDESGAVKAGAEMMTETDVLQVTAANGVNTAVYTVKFGAVGIENSMGNSVRIYPNPNTGQFFIEGARIGSRIHVYNNIGVELKSVVVYGDSETISLDNQPAGMYFITISNGDNVTGRYKVIKK